MAKSYNESIGSAKWNAFTTAMQIVSYGYRWLQIQIQIKGRIVCLGWRYGQDSVSAPIAK